MDIMCKGIHGYDCVSCENGRAKHFLMIRGITKQRREPVCSECANDTIEAKDIMWDICRIKGIVKIPSHTKMHYNKIYDSL